MPNEGQTKTVAGQHLVYTGDAWEPVDGYASAPAPAPVVAAPPPAGIATLTPVSSPASAPAAAAPAPNLGFYTPGMSAADYLAKDKAAFLPQTIAAIEGYYNDGGDGSPTYNPGTPEHLSTYANKNQAYTDWYDKAIASGQKFTPGAAPVYTPGMSSADYEAQALNAYTPTTIAATPGFYDENGTWNAPVAAHSSVYAGDQGAYNDWYKGQEAEALKYLPAGWQGGVRPLMQDDGSMGSGYLFGGPSSQYGSTYGDTSKDALANIAYRVVGGDSGGQTYQYQPYGPNGLIGTPTTQYTGVGTDDLFGGLINIGMAAMLGPTGLAGEVGAALGPSLGLGTVGSSALGAAIVNAGKTVATGGNLGDAITNAAESAAGSYLGNSATSGAKDFVNSVLPENLDPRIVKALAGTAGNVASDAVKSVITGKPVDLTQDVLLNLVGQGYSQVVSPVADQLNLTPSQVTSLVKFAQNGNVDQLVLSLGSGLAKQAVNSLNANAIPNVEQGPASTVANGDTLDNTIQQLQNAGLTTSNEAADFFEVPSNTAGGPNDPYLAPALTSEDAAQQVVTTGTKPILGPSDYDFSLDPDNLLGGNVIDTSSLEGAGPATSTTTTPVAAPVTAPVAAPVTTPAKKPAVTPTPTAAPAPTPAVQLHQDLMNLSDLDLEQLLDPTAYLERVKQKQNKKFKKSSNEESLMDLLETLGYRS